MNLFLVQLLSLVSMLYFIVYCYGVMKFFQNCVPTGYLQKKNSMFVQGAKLGNFRNLKKSKNYIE